MVKHAPRPRRATAVVAAALAAVVTATLSGCISLIGPPPDGAEEDLAALASRMRAVEAVQSVETTLYPADTKDDPDTWIATLRVVATTADLSVAQRLRALAESGVAGSELRVDLDVPAGPKSARVTVDALDPARVARADRFRRLPIAGAVTVLPFDSTVELVPGVTVSQAISSVRPAARESAVTLSRGVSSIDVGPEAPGPALASRLDELDADPHVTALILELRGASSLEGAGALLRVTTTDVKRIAAALAATRDESADAERTDRTTFAVDSVRSKEDSARPRILGYLGLPVGSPRPATLEEKATRPLTSTELARIDLTAEEAAVRSFLRSSMVRTGVSAAITVGRTTCSGERSVRATASVAAPIYQRYDDGQVPFDAVTAFWADEGLRHTDRALGLDIWTGAPRDGGVEEARIRGTSDGLSLAADSACVG